MHHYFCDKLRIGKKIQEKDDEEKEKIYTFLRQVEENKWEH